MTAAVIWLGYLLGWFVTAVMVTRWWVANRAVGERCHRGPGRCDSGCPPWCWRVDTATEPLVLLRASVVALGWPFILPMALVGLAASIKRGSRLLSAEQLAELEKAAGINQQ